MVHPPPLLPPLAHSCPLALSPSQAQGCTHKPSTLVCFQVSPACPLLLLLPIRFLHILQHPAHLFPPGRLPIALCFYVVAREGSVLTLFLMTKQDPVIFSTVLHTPQQIQSHAASAWWKDFAKNITGVKKSCFHCNSCSNT